MRTPEKTNLAGYSFFFKKNNQFGAVVSRRSYKHAIFKDLLLVVVVTTASPSNMTVCMNEFYSSQLIQIYTVTLIQYCYG